MPTVGTSPTAPIEIGLASSAERAWSAQLMASSEPWVTLKRDLAGCEAVLADLPDTSLYIARSGGVPRGFVLVRPRGLAGAPYIVSIASAADARGLGVGSQLIEFVATHVAPPSRHLFLCVSSFNVAARRLYERLGFVQVGEVPDYIVPGVAELIMHRRLAP